MLQSKQTKRQYHTISVRSNGRTDYCCLAFLIIFLALFSCCGEVPAFKNSGKGITSFCFLKADNPSLSEDVTCTIREDGTITGMFPEILENYLMVARFEYDGEFVVCNSRLQTSGKSVQDFLNKVVYEVKLRDGIIQKFTVIMSFPKKPSIPIIRIMTEKKAPVKDKVNYVPGIVEITDSDGIYWDTPELVLEMTRYGIRGRGNTTWDMPKKPYKLKFDEKTGIFRLPADREWVLLAEYADKTLLRNRVAMKLSEIVGMDWTPAMFPVELYLNNDYLGCYTFTEHKKVAKHRVNLDIATTADNSGEALTGDYYLEIESRQDQPCCFLSEINHIPMMFIEPEIPTQDQLAYVKEYFRDAELALNGQDFADPLKGWQKYIDIESFAKAFIVNELTKNIDGNMRKSSFIAKRRSGKLEMCHLWDYDLTIGNCDYMYSMSGGLATDGPEGWFVKTTSMDQGINWYIRLSEDPAFCAEVKRIWQEAYPRLKEVPAFIDRQAWLLDEAQKRNFERWDILGTYVWPNKVVTGKYSSEVAYMKDFYSRRLEWLNGKFEIREGEIFK